MPTFLFDEIIFGPVTSRRLGNSLGINLLPTNGKICNFNCIYCECGWSDQNKEKTSFPKRTDVKNGLEYKLKNFKQTEKIIDTITFAGNGEPTLHPDFAGIIDDTLEAVKTYMPAAKIAVLSNATNIHKLHIANALKKVDFNILKLDSAFDQTVRLLDNPPQNYSVAKIVESMKVFENNQIIQTMFVRGSIDGQTVDNATPEELSAWIQMIEKIAPRMVMIYTISRDTPIDSLRKVPIDELTAIGKEVEKLGIEIQISG